MGLDDALAKTLASAVLAPARTAVCAVAPPTLPNIKERAVGNVSKLASTSMP